MGHLLFTPATGNVSSNVMGTDLENFVFAHLEGIKSPFALEATQLTQFLAGLSSGDLVIVTKQDGNDKLTISCQGATLTSETFPVEDMPIAPEIPLDAPKLNIPAKDFYTMLQTCAPYMSNDETRYYLKGIYMHSKPNTNEGEPRTFSMVAADGKRMAEVHTTYANPCGDAIINSSTVDILSTIVDKKSNQNISLSILEDDKGACFMGDNWHVVSRVIAGTYPNYSRISSLCKEADRTTISTKVMLNSLKIFNTKNVINGFAPIVIDGPNNQVSQGGMCAALELDGLEYRFGVSGFYLKEAMNALSIYGNDANLFIKDPREPLGLTPKINPQWGDVKLTVMPVGL